MRQTQGHDNGPPVTVVIRARRGGRQLRQTLKSVSRQTHRNLQVIVAANSDAHLAGLVEMPNPPEMVILPNKEPSGLAATLNRALERAKGSYVAYLDDDALYYPGHVQRLVEALEAQTACDLAYGDLYVTHRRALPDGGYEVLGKTVRLSRDFDRFFLLQFKPSARFGVMHRRELLDRVGSFNEDLRWLAEWDMYRRMAFFTDFLRIDGVTGEIVSPPPSPDGTAGDAPPSPKEYLQEVLAVRAARPAKPWPKMPDLSIIFTHWRWERSARRSLGRIRMWTFAPHQVYMPLPAGELDRARAVVPEILGVPVPAGCTLPQRLDGALARCQGEYTAIVPDGLEVGPMWVEPALHALVSSRRHKEGIRLGDGRSPWAAVLRTDELRAARQRHPTLSVQESLQADSVAVRPVTRRELPFHFDDLFARARLQEREGDWLGAAGTYESMHRLGACRPQIKHRLARALYHAQGRDEQARHVCREINRRHPTVESLLLEARLCRRADRLPEAVKLLQKAKEILQWKV